MRNVLITVCKTVILGVVMYFSVTVFGFSHHVSLLMASIPVVLMVLSIYSGFAFRLVAVVFLLACAKVAVLDAGYSQKHIADSISDFLNGLMSKLQA